MELYIIQTGITCKKIPLQKPIEFGMVWSRSRLTMNRKQKYFRPPTYWNLIFAFGTLKEIQTIVTTEAVLSLFDNKFPIEIQVDASSHCLGESLMQNKSHFLFFMKLNKRWKKLCTNTKGTLSTSLRMREIEPIHLWANCSY